MKIPQAASGNLVVVSPGALGQNLVRDPQISPPRLFSLILTINKK